MKQNNSILIVIVAIIVGVASFFAGMKYQQTQRPGFARFANGPAGRNGQAGNRAGFRPISGDIIASDDTSLTVKLQDGSSKIVLLSDKTEINKADKAAREDLKVGEKVAIFGSENSDGSVTAQSIQLGLLFRGMSGRQLSPTP